MGAAIGTGIKHPAPGIACLVDVSLKLVHELASLLRKIYLGLFDLAPLGGDGDVLDRGA